MKTPARCYLLCCQVRAGIRDAIEFNRSMTVFLDNENRRWVTTPRRYVAETWTYDLEVRVNRHHRSAGQLPVASLCSSESIYGWESTYKLSVIPIKDDTVAEN